MEVILTRAEPCAELRAAVDAAAPGELRALLVLGQVDACGQDPGLAVAAFSEASAAGATGSSFLAAWATVDPAAAQPSIESALARPGPDRILRLAAAQLPGTPAERVLELLPPEATCVRGEHLVRAAALPVADAREVLRAALSAACDPPFPRWAGTDLAATLRVRERLAALATEGGDPVDAFRNVARAEALREGARLAPGPPLPEPPALAPAATPEAAITGLELAGLVGAELTPWLEPAIVSEDYCLIRSPRWRSLCVVDGLVPERPRPVCTVTGESARCHVEGDGAAREVGVTRRGGRWTVDGQGAS